METTPQIFPEPNKPNCPVTPEPATENQVRQYQGYGIVEGVLTISPEAPTLLVGNSVLAACSFIPASVRKHPYLGQVQRFSVFPGSQNGQPRLHILQVVKPHRSPTPILLKGCWQLLQDWPFVVIYRNRLDGPTDRRTRIVVPVVWDNAPPADGQFWELEAEIEEGNFVIKKASGPFEPPPKVSRFDPNQTGATRKGKQQKAKTAPASPTLPSSEPYTPLSPSEIRAMATPSKIQIICKVDRVPQYRELPDKRLEFYLMDGSANNIIFTACLKPKQFKKFTDHGYSHWVATVTGEIGAATATGFELFNPSVQVFEKKAKTENETEATASGTASEAGKEAEKKALAQPVAEQRIAPATAAQAMARPPQAESTPSKKKNLMAGVRVK